MTRLLTFWAALMTVTACGEGEDALAAVDKQYRSIMVDVGVADRDTTRNIRNREARQRKVKAENRRVAFFHDKKVQSAIDGAMAHMKGTPIRAKAEAYLRHMVVTRPWTEAEKSQETQLIARIDEIRGTEATWSSADGKVEIELGRNWREVTKEADELDDAQRADVTQHFIEHNMRAAGADLQSLVQLRNKVAQREGYKNYWELALTSQGLTPADVDRIVKEMSEVVKPLNDAVAAKVRAQAESSDVEYTFANHTFLRRRAGLEAGRDTADTFFDTDLAEERVMRAFQDMGIATDGWQVYTGPPRYVRRGVYGFPIRPPEYIAIVMSQNRRWSMWQYEALAHEGGHAVWWKALPDDAIASPVLWEPASPWFEGFAQFFERLVYEPAFTARYVPELPADQRPALDAWRRTRAAASITDNIVDTLVERRLYEDPNSLEAIAKFAAETRSMLTGTPKPSTNSAGLVYDSSLLNIIAWKYPAYSQNYLFAAMTEAWMFEAISDAVGDPIGNAKVGPLVAQKLVRGRVTDTFPDRLSAFFPGSRTGPLKRYLPDPSTLAVAPPTE